MDEQPKGRTRPLNLRISVGGPQAWFAIDLAEHWLADAVQEARNDGVHARRREIVFSCCFAETYLYEWVRDAVLDSNYSDLERLFPPKDKKGLQERLKDVTKELYAQGRIANRPDLSDETWKNFVQVIDYRNGFIHAKASRPRSDSQASPQQPVPSLEVLNSMGPGWALRAILTTFARLHSSAGTEPPLWLREVCCDHSVQV